MRMTSRSLVCVWTAVVAFCTTACERPMPVSPLHSVSASSARVPVPAPAADSAMGALSQYAQVVVAALGDSVTRIAVWEKLRSPSTPLEGIDLQSCGSDAVVDRLLLAGQRRAGRSAAEVCSALQKMPGAILYMDRSRLKQWDGTSIPLVTAIERPDDRLPKILTVYRSARRTMSVPSDGSTLGPVLVILPYTHPSHRPGVVPSNDPPAVVLRTPSQQQSERLPAVLPAP